MGLIKAVMGAASGTLADQWIDYFTCDSIPNDVLVVKGKKNSSRRSSNNNGSENVITSGSGIVVADGQCMIIVDQGEIVEVCDEPGKYTYDQSSEPSIFTSPDLKAGVMSALETFGKRFKYGGEVGNDQRVYYFNMKELVDNKFGTPNPIPFRVLDRNIGLDIDVSVRCSGVYSYKIKNPLLFYSNVCGNVQREYTKDEIDGQLKAEFIGALQPAFAKISDLGIRPSSIPTHAAELSQIINDVLAKKWAETRGLEVVSISLNPITLPPEDAELIKQAQRTAIMRDPNMAAATLVGAQADAMKAAASNTNGAMMGFMGMNMTSQAGGMNAQNLFAMGQQQAMYNQQQMNNQPTPQSAPSQGADSWKCNCGATNTGKFCMECGSKKPEPQPAGSWKCKCGATNTGKFCMECGTPKPSQEEGWVCSCGAVNKGKFCMECGTPKPTGAPLYRCDKCGWEPADPKNPPRFCPICGDPFDSNDIR